MAVQKSARPSMRAIKKDPPMRKNKKCYVCGEPLSPLCIKEGDPFCSNKCCKAYFEPLEGEGAT